MNARAAISIVGGGPVGATLALALQKQGIACLVLEARAPAAAQQDQRALALSYGSRMILQRLGLWQPLAPSATAIKTIHISQRGSLGRTLLEAREQGQEALGYVVSYGALMRVLEQALIDSSVDVRHEAAVSEVLPLAGTCRVRYENAGQTVQMESALAVLADGGRSLGDIPGLQRKTREYGHDALVTRVSAELSHDNIAYERFTPSGPVALLPNGTRDFSLVWTGLQQEIKRLLTLEDDAFLRALHAHFGDRVGRFLSVTGRRNFPLVLSRLSPVTLPHLAVIGNAAQTMHPVAGQGFNVGMRDAWNLSQQLAAVEPAMWGDPSMLRAYERSRRRDTRNGLLFTDFLVNVFSNDIIGVSGLRGIALGALEIAAPAKRLLIDRMSFGVRG